MTESQGSSHILTECTADAAVAFTAGGLYMAVEVHLPPERTFTFEVNVENETVRDLKERIEAAHGLGANFQALMHGSVQLSNPDERLAAYNLEHPARLELFMLVRGLYVKFLSTAAVLERFGNEWGCPVCTFLNPDVEPFCGMCQADKPVVVDRERFALDVARDANAAAVRAQVAATLGMDVGEVWLERPGFLDPPEDQPASDWLADGDLVTVYLRAPVALRASLYGDDQQVHDLEDLFTSSTMADVVAAFLAAAGDTVGAGADPESFSVFRLNDYEADHDGGGDGGSDGGSDGGAMAIANDSLSSLLDLRRLQAYLPHSRLVTESFEPTDQIVLVRQHDVTVEIRAPQPLVRDPIPFESAPTPGQADTVSIEMVVTTMTRVEEIVASAAEMMVLLDAPLIVLTPEGRTDGANTRALVGDLVGGDGETLVLNLSQRDITAETWAAGAAAITGISFGGGMQVCCYCAM